MGPDGGAAVRGPEGTYAQGAYGGTTVNVNQGWGAYYGPGYGAGAVAAGVAAGLAIGSSVASLPDAADTIVVGGQDYYVADGVYYQPCYVGADVYYCVVAAPSY